MMTNLHRPCTITYPLVVNEGKPFDAMVLEIGFHVNDQDLYLTHSNSVDEPITFHHVFHFDTLSELERVKHSVEWQIAEALNAPIPVTQEVLDGLPKDAKILGRRVDVDEGTGNAVSWCVIKSIECPQTLEYLLQFTLDGKRKETE